MSYAGHSGIPAAFRSSARISEIPRNNNVENPPTSSRELPLFVSVPGEKKYKLAYDRYMCATMTMTLLDSQGRVTVVIYDYYVMYEYVLALVVCICLKSLMFPLNKWFVPVSFSLYGAAPLCLCSRQDQDLHCIIRPNRNKSIVFATRQTTQSTPDRLILSYRSTRSAPKPHWSWSLLVAH